MQLALLIQSHIKFFLTSILNIDTIKLSEYENDNLTYVVKIH